MDSKEYLLKEWQDDDVDKTASKESRTNGSPHKASWKHIASWTLMGLTVVGFLAHFRDSHGQPPKPGHVVEGMRAQDGFTNIPSSEQLEWHDCFGRGFFCAKLTVPMDYNRPLSVSRHHPKVEIALIMLASEKSMATGKHSISPLLLNPGGPGGSGVGFLLGLGSQLQQLLPDQDFVSFDPRGIGLTTPQADCFSFPSNGEEFQPGDYDRGGFNRMNFMMMGKEIGLVNSSNVALSKLDARARMVAKLCQYKDDSEGENSILRHLSTPAVAQDMISIIDAWDTWRENTGQSSSDAIIEQENDLTKSTKGKLVYWGFSYGTLLGATFASMFPDRVGRVVLDGVVDADYYVGPIWGDSLRDTDAAEASFFRYCYEGKDTCALYRDGNSEEDVKATFTSIMEKLRKNPVTGISRIYNVPVEITYQDLKMVIFSSLYFPIMLFPIIAQVLDMFNRGMEQIILDNFVFPIEYKPFCGGQYFHPGGDALNAIMCSDKRYPLNETVQDIQARFEKMSNVSTYADVWTSLMVGCDGWDIVATDPPMRWDRHPAHKQKPINTSFPLLFISNTADPVTPLYAGVKMAKKFVGAGLVEQLSEGHCSLSTVSLCTINKILGYFLKGEVPPPPKLDKNGDVKDGEWDRCERDQWPFKNTRVGKAAALKKEDVTNFKAWEIVGRKAMELQWYGARTLPPGWIEAAWQVYYGLKLSDLQTSPVGYKGN